MPPAAAGAAAPPVPNRADAMTSLPMPRRPTGGAGLGILAGLGFFVLGGCANGDFGRIRPSLVDDNVHGWVGAEAARAYGQPVSPYELTDLEKKLRDLAYPLIEPPYDRNRWYSILNEYGITRHFDASGLNADRTAYADELMSSLNRSSTTRYAQLNDDIRNDVTRLGPFFMTARKVADLDRKREQSLAHIPGVSSNVRIAALSRVNENKLVVVWVHRSLAERAASYRIALERLVVATPADMAATADRSLSLLQQKIAENRPAPVALLW